MKKSIANILPMIFILAMASCSSREIATPEPSTITPMATSKLEVASPVPTVVPEPMPTGYADLLQNKLTSGEWTLGEGLVTLLRMFTGEIQVSEANLGLGVLTTEGTGIIQLAVEYLQSGTDQAARDEIVRLLDVLIPSQEALDRYSIPEDQVNSLSRRTSRLAAPPRQDEAECANLWSRGFPVLALPSFPCFKFGERTIAGNSYLVYYPLAWEGDETRVPYYAATLDAVEESIAVYRNLGMVKPIYFVFSTLNYGGFDAFTYYEWYWGPDRTVHTDRTERLPEACPIFIHPAAMTGNDPVHFKQLIAHEIAHCFQSWNLTDQLIGPGDDSMWWSEGMAEYFSNLVYKDVDSEHQYIERFSNYSTTRPLTGMSYENFAFFQFLGNRIGPEGVISMLRTMPTSPSLDAQLAALAAVPGMETTFEEFVRSVMDGTLEDTNKTRIIFPDSFTDQVYFTDIESKEFSGQPFVVARYLASFPVEKMFAVETNSQGEGRSAWRANESARDWGPFPATASGRCNELLYILYAITTTPGAERKETIATTMVSADPCDECLIGRWQATTDSIISYMQSVANASGGSIPTVQSVTGIQFLSFGADGIGSGGYEHLQVRESGVGDVTSTEVSLTFDGFASGPYTADGSVLNASYQSGLAGTEFIVVTAELFANGIPVGTSIIPFRQEDLPVASGIPTNYTCEGDVLTMFPPVEGVTVEPVMYIRSNP